MATIYCMGCGCRLEEGTRFCPECGTPTRLGAELAASAEAVPPAVVQAAVDQTVVAPERVVASEPQERIVEPVREEPLALPRRRLSPLLVGGIAAALALTLGLVAGVASGVLGGGKLPSLSVPKEETPSEVPQVTEDAELGTAGIAVRETMADYSWQELSIIGKEMTRRASRNEALTLAHEYHLVDELGHMTTVTKDLTVAGLGTVPMRLADVYHDALANGEGMAGLTFLAADATLTHQMKANDDNIGGWEASQMRSWLGSEGFDRLDGELAPLIVAVDKHTNNTGATTSTDSVTSTLDTLWVPSVVEVCGPVGWLWDSDPGNSEAYNAVLAAEGSQYACFAEQGVSTSEDNASLVLEGSNGPVAWGLRSSSVSKAAHYRMVDEAGNASRWGEGPSELGVCLGFCL